MGFKFDKSNTLIIDTDEVSVANHPENALIMEKYDRDNVVNAKLYKNENMEMNILKLIKIDLFMILNTKFDDVRDFMKHHLNDNREEQEPNKIKLSPFL